MFCWFLLCRPSTVFSMQPAVPRVVLDQPVPIEVPARYHQRVYVFSSIDGACCVIAAIRRYRANKDIPVTQEQ